MLAIAFDTETSGLVYNQTVKIDKQPEVVEFYGCLFDLKNGKIKQEMDCLIKPRNGLKLEETKLKTLTEDMFTTSPPFIFYAKAIKEILESAPVVIGHNVAFDMEMIDIEMKRCDMKVDWGRPICTVEQSIHLKGYRLSLTDLHAELFNEPFSGAHRAKADVMATIRCAVELYKRKEL